MNFSWPPFGGGGDFSQPKTRKLFSVMKNKRLVRNKGHES